MKIIELRGKLAAARLAAWWRHLTRDRAAELLAAHDQAEHAIRYHPSAERLWPDGPHLAARWPDCDPQDPCGTRWNGDADRAEWHECASHPPRGRHRQRPADATEVISLAEWKDRVR